MNVTQAAGHKGDMERKINHKKKKKKKKLCDEGAFSFQNKQEVGFLEQVSINRKCTLNMANLGSQIKLRSLNRYHKFESISKQ